MFRPGDSPALQHRGSLVRAAAAHRRWLRDVLHERECGQRSGTRPAALKSAFGRASSSWTRYGQVVHIGNLDQDAYAFVFGQQGLMAGRARGTKITRLKQ